MKNEWASQADDKRSDEVRHEGSHEGTHEERHEESHDGGHHWTIALFSPLHSRLGNHHGLLSYRSETALSPGQLVRVPLGKQEVLGVVWAKATGLNDVPLARIRPIAEILPLAPLSTAWRNLIAFGAHYYQRSLGELALMALPTALKNRSGPQIERALHKLRPPKSSSAASSQSRPVLSVAQQEVMAAWRATQESIQESQEKPPPRPQLLFGVTGSGKTEIYLQLAEAVLHNDPLAQVLVLVPEINLTPQLQSRFKARFSSETGGAKNESVVPLHSGLTPAQRLHNWLLAHTGQARIVLGTRLAVLASLPHLGLIIVDEEHDPSYKQQEGARYHAKDLAIYRGHHEQIPVLLGSATPSLESWWACEQGRYGRLVMQSRPTGRPLPEVRLVDMRQQAPQTMLAPVVWEALKNTVAHQEQALVFLNRRGYAPSLICQSCDWTSQCPHCSAYRVFHKQDRSLRCHHCGLTQPVPRVCPHCGNPDIHAQGKGTQRLEEHLLTELSTWQRPDGQAVRVRRIDSDTTQAAHSLAEHLQAIHDSQVDVLVGTQMLTKGHDFEHLSQVVAVQPDAALFSADFRASERLFAQLMQAAGRCGRSHQQHSTGTLWVQTRYPDHPLLIALQAHDYGAFSRLLLEERRSAGLPPFRYQAMLYAHAKTAQAALGFLQAAKTGSAQCLAYEHVNVYDPIPVAMSKVADVERAQLLVESAQRPALQAFLRSWQTVLHHHASAKCHAPLLRWFIDVDPLEI